MVLLPLPTLLIPSSWFCSGGTYRILKGSPGNFPWGLCYLQSSCSWGSEAFSFGGSGGREKLRTASVEWTLWTLTDDSFLGLSHCVLKQSNGKFQKWRVTALLSFLPFSAWGRNLTLLYQGQEPPLCLKCLHCICYPPVRHSIAYVQTTLISLSDGSKVQV